MKNTEFLKDLYFYPRSPCGERRVPSSTVIVILRISIHALLAESDSRHSINCMTHTQFLSTLSLRRATENPLRQVVNRRISIHALLAESDLSGRN